MARGSCIEVINAYRRDYLVRLVVCSRMTDYLMLQRRLLLPSAIVVQPLTNGQIDTYLLTAGPELAAIRTILQENLVLCELAASPLMLNLLVRTYQSSPQEELPTTGSLEEQQRSLFARYLKRMLFDKHLPRQTPPARLLSGLIWLACQMQQQNRTVFYLEQLQPSFLFSDDMQRTYTWLAIRVPGILMGLFILIVIITLFSNTAIISGSGGLLIGLLLFFPLVLLGSLFSEPGLIPDSPETKKPLEDKSQQPQKREHKGSSKKVLSGLFSGLLVSLLVWWTFGLVIGLLAGLLVVLLVWLRYKLIPLEDKSRLSPQKPRRRPGIGTIYALLAAVASSLIFSLSILLATYQNGLLDTRHNDRLIALVLGFILMAIVGLFYGLIFAIGTFILRLILQKKPPKENVSQKRYFTINSVIRKLVTSQDYNKPHYNLVALLVGGAISLIISREYRVFLGLVVVLLLFGLIFATGRFLSRRLRYGLICGLVFGLLFWLVSGLFFWLLPGQPGRYEGQTFELALVDGMSVGILAGVISGLLGALLVGKNMLVQPADRLVWSWNGLRRSLLMEVHIRSTLGIILSLWLLDVLSYAFSYGSYGLSYEFVYSLANELPIGLAYWFLVGIFQGVARETIEDQQRTVPNQGIRQSGINGLIFGLISMLTVGFSIITSLWFFNGVLHSFIQPIGYFPLTWPSTLPIATWNITSYILLALLGGVSAGLAIVFLYGGWDWLRHYTLRMLLWRAGVMPWNYVGLLDEAARHILLRKVGGGYTFIHRLFQNYVASLDSASFLSSFASTASLDSTPPSIQKSSEEDGRLV